jgi:type I restriction enzyme, R subunit
MPSSTRSATSARSGWRCDTSVEVLLLFRPPAETESHAHADDGAGALLEKLKQLLVLNWRQKSSARSQLKLSIEDVLDSGLPRAYTPELYQQKCSVLFEHFYEAYPERDAGVYAGAA